MVQVVILAAGKGTRMKSELPKVLHEVNGVPIITRLLESVSSVCPRPSLIVGHKAEEVIAATGNKFHYIHQKEQLGTGHALKCAREELKQKNIRTLIVLPGDHPLVSVETLKSLIKLHDKSGATLTLGTTTVPTYDSLYSVFLNFGRIIRNADGGVDRIVEYKDATDAERAVKEVNLSYYCFDAKWLWQNLDKITNANASGEYYLTDMVKIARDQGKKVAAYIIDDKAECLGINTPEQLHIVETAAMSRA